MRTCFHHDREGAATLDLRASARVPALDDLPELDERSRAVAVRTWRGRMVNEHLSAQVWASLVPQAMRAALPPAVLAGLAAAASDELRHAELCAGVVVALGGQPVAPLPPVEPVPGHADAGPLEAVLRNLISVGCVSETVAVAVIRAEHAELEHSALADVLAGILADEVRHARLGWRVFGQVAPLLDDAARERTWRYLVEAFAHQLAYELPRLPVGEDHGDAAARAGVCDGGFARRVFLDTMANVVVPGLARGGLDARGAWDAALDRSRHLMAS